MRSGFATLVALSLAAILSLRVAVAMQFDLVDVSPTEVMIDGRGPIVRGDAARLEKALASVPSARRLLGLALDSPGGTVLDGAELARMIRDRGLAVVVPTNSKCASACFLMLAAAPRRLVANDALIGVHSANDDGQDTEVAMAMTTAMARTAGELGVPPAIIGKMVETSPSRIEWLTPADLRAMGVVVYGDADAPSVVRGAASAAVPPVGQPQDRPAALSVEAGRTDRLAWQGWLATLRGPYRDGALFWASEHLMPQPGSCSGPNGVSRGDFTLGCEAARQRLALSDGKSRASADYRTGWTGQPSSVSNADMKQLRPDAEFEGAVFCGQSPTHLVLKLLPAADPAHRRAVYSLGLDSSGRSAAVGLVHDRGPTGPCRRHHRPQARNDSIAGRRRRPDRAGGAVRRRRQDVRRSRDGESALHDVHAEAHGLTIDPSRLLLLSRYLSRDVQTKWPNSAKSVHWRGSDLFRRRS